MGILTWWRRLVKENRGAATLEKTLMVGTAVAVGTTFGAGAMKTGSSAAKQTQRQVETSSKQPQLERAAGVTIRSGVVTGPFDVLVKNAIKDDVASGPVVKSATIQLVNKSVTPFDLKNTRIEYADNEQRITLCNGAEAVVVGREVRCGEIRFIFRQGHPLSPSRPLPPSTSQRQVEDEFRQANLSFRREVQMVQRATMQERIATSRSAQAARALTFRQNKLAEAEAALAADPNNTTLQYNAQKAKAAVDDATADKNRWDSIKNRWTTIKGNHQAKLDIARTAIQRAQQRRAIFARPTAAPAITREDVVMMEVDLGDLPLKLGPASEFAILFTPLRGQMAYMRFQSPHQLRPVSRIN